MYPCVVKKKKEKRKKITWKNSIDKLDGEFRTKPPLRNDQHPCLAKTVPIQLYVSSSALRLAFMRAEPALPIFTQPVN